MSFSYALKHPIIPEALLRASEERMRVRSERRDAGWEEDMTGLSVGIAGIRTKITALIYQNIIFADILMKTILNRRGPISLLHSLVPALSAVIYWVVTQAGLPFPPRRPPTLSFSPFSAFAN